MEPKDRIILAVDSSLAPIGRSIVNHLVDMVGGIKLGSTAVNCGYAHELISVVKKKKKILFWDLKTYEIPNMMFDSVRAISSAGADWISVSAYAGIESIRSALSARGRSLILGATVLSSVSPKAYLNDFDRFLEDQVLRYADMLLEVKAQGVIVSPCEVKLLSSESKHDSLIKVAVEIRPSWASPEDQERYMTPADAIRAGADYLVIGRPITHPPDCTPEVAVERILDEIEIAKL